jgi:hypothetical protein
LLPGTYYLTKVDEKFRRFYALKGHEQEASISPKLPKGSKQAERLASLNNHFVQKQV